MRCRLLAVLAAFVLALPALALAEPASSPVRLVAPRAGATLAAGSTAEIEWAPLARFAELREAEEWEAFLSVDGGATYPMRITPHLDSDLRHFRFQVPPVPTPNARILLRFGDERRETAVEFPERFAIEAPATLPVPEETLLRARLAFSAGEPAFPGGAGVVAWVEGSRRGGGLRQVVAADPPGLQAQPSLSETHGGTVVLASDPAPPQPQDSRSGTAAGAPGSLRASITLAGTGPPLHFDILLLTQRQNE